MRIRTFLSCLGTALTFSFSPIAQADVSLTYQSVVTAEYRSTLLVRDDFIRFENPKAPEFFMLFNAQRQQMILVDSDKQSYSILDRETLESLSEQIEVTRKAIMAELRASMKVASAEERSQMAEILDQITALSQTGEKAVVEYRPLDKERVVNGYSCQLVNALVNDNPQAELCVAKAEDVGVTEAIMATLQSFHNFSDSIHQQLNPGDTTELLFVMNSRHQLPVSVRRIYPPSAADKYELIQVQTLSIPDSAFAIPEGFEAKDIEDAFIVE